MSAQNPRFPLFDSLRAIAALTVVLFHVAFVEHGFTSRPLDKYFVELDIGVTIFFLISGFLLYRPFVAARFGGDRLPAAGPYAIRRVFRIVPAYWVALLLVAIWVELPVVLNNPVPYFGFAQVYQRSTLANGYGIAWTLCIEMSFYVMLPLWALALRRLPGRSRRALVASELAPLAAIFAFAVVWNATQVSNAHFGFVPITPAVAILPAFLDYFALGMALAVASVWLAGRDARPLAVRVVDRASWLPWLLAAALWVVMCNINSFHESSGNVVRHVMRGFIALGVLLPAIFGEDRGGAVRRVLADRRLQWLGLISYSLYLWHSAVITKLARAGWDHRLGGWLPFSVLSIAASVAVAAVSFYVVERPGLRIGRRLAGRRGYQDAERPPAGSVDRPGAPSVELAGADRPRP